jgi:hypothetical protein
MHASLMGLNWPPGLACCFFCCLGTINVLEFVAVCLATTFSFVHVKCAMHEYCNYQQACIEIEAFPTVVSTASCQMLGVE